MLDFRLPSPVVLLLNANQFCAIARFLGKFCWRFVDVAFQPAACFLTMWRDAPKKTFKKLLVADVFPACQCNHHPTVGELLWKKKCNGHQSLFSFRFWYSSGCLNSHNDFGIWQPCQTGDFALLQFSPPITKLPPKIKKTLDSKVSAFWLCSIAVVDSGIQQPIVKQNILKTRFTPNNKKTGAYEDILLKFCILYWGFPSCNYFHIFWIGI